MSDEQRDAVRRILERLETHQTRNEHARTTSALKALLIYAPAHTKTINQLLINGVERDVRPLVKSWYLRANVLADTGEIRHFRVIRYLLSAGAVADAIPFCRRAARYNPLNAIARLYLADMESVEVPIQDTLLALRHVLVLDPGLAVAAAKYAGSIALGGPDGWSDAKTTAWRGRARLSAPHDRVVHYSLVYDGLRHKPLSAKAWRVFSEAYADSLAKGRFTKPPLRTWTGEPVGEGKLAIWSEDVDGMGDILLHAGCIPHLERDGIRGRVRVPARLKSLFERSFPNWTIVSDEAPDLSDCRYVANFLDLSGYVEAGRNDAYLRADADLANRLRARYNEHGYRRVIGISWRGGSGPVDKRARSIPLDTLDALIGETDALFVNLQHGAASDLAELSARHRNFLVDEDLDPMGDLDQFAAQVAAMDLVVSVNNTTANLAGGLGRPTLCMVPRITQWWWGVQGTSTPWYPTMRLIRQTTPGDWNQVVGDVKSALDESVAGRGGE